MIILQQEQNHSFANLTLLYLSSLIQVGRTLGATPISPVEVKLKQLKPKNTEPFRDFFGCPVYFAQSASSITVYKDDLDIPFTAHDPRYSQLANDLADEDLRKLNAHSASEEVCVHIKNTLAEGEPKIAVVATAMGLSPRSLQRKLSAENKTFATLLDNTRKHIAYEKILLPDSQIKTLAYDLGFSNQSNFNRAFKRWYAASPTEYRRKLSE